ncbi:MAG: hypothetical protein ACYTFK_10790 [Planctomycetota bacterium]|jgi:hypothetical protein
MLRLKKKSVVTHLIITSLVVALLVSGCSDMYGRVLKPGDDRVEITKTHSDFSEMANRSNLPFLYVSEGKIGVTKVEAAMEEADAVDVQARAVLNKKLADFSAQRVEVTADVNKNIAHASALREKYKKEYSKALAQISARETGLGALIERKDTIIASLTKEGGSKCKDIIANGQEKHESEIARIEQIKEIRNAIDAESNAKILEMTQASKATRERAAATILDLEAKAKAIQLEKLAKVDELDEKIKSTTIQTQSEVERLNVTREALIKDSQARVKELRAKAATIGDNFASQQYQLQLTKAASAKAETQAKTEEKLDNAPTRFEKAIAEIDRLRAEMNFQMESSSANYESMIAEIQTKLDSELNEIKKIRSRADRVEEVARAEFVKAEAAALAEAVRQTAIHAEAVAEAEEFNIIAEAEAEAAKIKQKLFEEIAAKKASNRVEKKKNTTPESQQTEELHQVPAIPQVEAVATRIEPDHIADYRKSLANVMKINAKAEARQMVAEATFAEAKTNLMAIKRQEDAIASEQLAIAAALEAQARSRFNEIETKIEKEMDVVESKYQQELVQAESFRKEKQAEALDYQSQADALEQIANARAEQLLAESYAVAKCGENDVEELKIALWAAQERGDAEYSKLTTEAQSIAQSQEAFALQIDAQVDSARRHLGAELAKLDNSIESAQRITQADYQEALTQAEVLQQKTNAQIGRTNAQFAMEQSILRAQIQRDKELALSQSIRGDVACDRIVANANSKRMRDIAGIDAMHVTAQADMNIILSENSSKRDTAQAYLDAVKARFNARIQQVKAERTIAGADEQYAMAIKRTDLASALAQARAAREETDIKLAELKKRQAELQIASKRNWSAKLAMFKNDNGWFEVDQVATAPSSQPVESTTEADTTLLTYRSK